VLFRSVGGVGGRVIFDSIVGAFQAAGASRGPVPPLEARAPMAVSE